MNINEATNVSIDLILYEKPLNLSQKYFQPAKMFRNHFAWRVIPINVYRWWLLFHFKLFVHYHLFFMNRTQKICTFNNGEMEWLEPHVCAHKQKKHHQNKVKIFAVFMFNCIYARRWRSAIKMNEKKNTHQTSRSKCNNGLKWFVHTEKNRIYIHHMQKSKGNSWKTKDERKRTNKSHTHDVQINNNCVCYL